MPCTCHSDHHHLHERGGGAGCMVGVRESVGGQSVQMYLRKVTVARSNTQEVLRDT